MTLNSQWIVAGLAVTVAVATAAYLLWPRDKADVSAGLINPDDAALVAAGAVVYERNCAACHGAERRGHPDWRSRGADGLLLPPPLDGSGHSSHHPDGLLFGIVRDGPAAYGPPGYRSAMPAFKDRLSEREIGAVLSYVQNKWSRQVRAAQAEITRRVRKDAGY